ncbi:MAG: AI-2E family transporter [Anaerolineae bacterium]|nr:AI-2E family transporter [Anaerolineae bacterium]
MSTEWNKTTKHIVAVGMALFGLYLLYLSAPVLKIFGIAALVAFLLMPVVTFLHKRLKIPRVLATLLSYLVLIVVILLAPLVMLPPVIDGFNVIAGINYQALTENLFRWTEETLVTLSQVQTSILGFSIDLSSVVKPALEALRNTSLTKVMVLPSYENIFTSVRPALSLTLGVATNLAGSVVTGALALILILVYSIYFSLDANKLGPRFLRVVPEAYRPEIATLLNRLSVTWRAYFRGQIILMFTVGTITLIGNSALGLPGAFSLAVIAGLLELIPNFGPFIAVVPAIVVALLQGSAYWEVNNFIFALMVIGFYILVQQVENNFIVPRVLGGAVKLHPLVIMGGVVVGATVAGIAGALLAAPVIASGKEIMSYLYAKILGQDPFPPTQEAPNEESILWQERLQGLWAWWRRFIAQWSNRWKPAKKEQEPQSKSLQEGQGLDKVRSEQGE